LGQDGTEIFLQKGLDRNLVICPSGSRIDPVQQIERARRMLAQRVCAGLR
jgi:hypothetical protein